MPAKTDISSLNEELGKIYVYVIGDGQNIKIGKARDWEQRLRNLQTANPRHLKLKGLRWVDDTSDLEREAHIACSSFRLRGEWFRDCSELWQTLEKLGLGYLEIESCYCPSCNIFDTLRGWDEDPDGCDWCGFADHHSEDCNECFNAGTFDEDMNECLSCGYHRPIQADPFDEVDHRLKKTKNIVRPPT